MTQGVLIFAHNNRDIDYAAMAIIAGGLAKKHLNTLVSLVTDASTIEWMQSNNTYGHATKIFDKIIEVDTPASNNRRRLHDGANSKTVPFVNSNRASVWDVTPYEKTLLIDSDFLILSNRLNEYWYVDADIMIGDSMNDILSQSRAGYHDRYISDTGPKLYWATTVMFTKNKTSKLFFELVNTIRNNYHYYGDMYGFDPSQYRNDISFSIAKHIMNGFNTEEGPSLPPVFTTIDKDILYKVDTDEKLTFLINNDLNSNYCATTVKGLDVHVMNKQSLIRNIDAFLELI
jgi:hypothetical protein